MNFIKNIGIHFFHICLEQRPWKKEEKHYEVKNGITVQKALLTRNSFSPEIADAGTALKKLI
jgi:hypothetical protein